MTETEVEISIAKWLQNNYNTVYFNRHIKNRQDKIFVTKGITKERPDLVVFSSPIYIAIEVKDAKETRNVHDATKILEYQKAYLNKETRYYIDGNEIIISLFIVATQYSIEGRLIKEDSNIRTKETYPNHPPLEFERTADYIRNVWAMWRRTRKAGEPGIGILLSSVNDKQDGFIYPRIFCQQYLNNRWNVRWIPL